MLNTLMEWLLDAFNAVTSTISSAAMWIWEEAGKPALIWFVDKVLTPFLKMLLQTLSFLGKAIIGFFSSAIAVIFTALTGILVIVINWVVEEIGPILKDLTAQLSDYASQVTGIEATLTNMCPPSVKGIAEVILYAFNVDGFSTALAVSMSVWSACMGVWIIYRCTVIIVTTIRGGGDL